MRVRAMPGGHGGEIAHFDDPLARDRSPDPACERILDRPVEVLLEEQRMAVRGRVTGGRLPSRQRVADAEQMRREVRHPGAVGAMKSRGDEKLERGPLRMRPMDRLEARRGPPVEDGWRQRVPRAGGASV